MHKQLAQNPISPTVAALMLQAQLTPLVSWRMCFELLTEEEISQPVAETQLHSGAAIKGSYERKSPVKEP